MAERDSKGRFIKGHKSYNAFQGKNHTEEAKEKNRLAHIGKMANEKNPAWKGNEVGYAGLHLWTKRHLKKSLVCDHCKKDTILELANKSHIYKRDLTDWLWLCKKCHIKYDGWGYKKGYIPWNKGKKYKQSKPTTEATKLLRSSIAKKLWAEGKFRNRKPRKKL